MRFELTDIEAEDGPKLVCPACGMPPRQEDTYRPTEQRMTCRLVCDSCSGEAKLRCSWDPHGKSWKVEQEESPE